MMETNRNDRAVTLASHRGFRAVHLLVIPTAVITNIIGAFTHTSGASTVASICGVLVSAMTIWYVIKAWKNHEFTGSAFTASIWLYAIANIDELGGMLAKGIGGEWAGTYFNVVMPASILVILGMWAWLIVSSAEYKASREEKAIETREGLAKSRIQFRERLDRIAAKEEKLLEARLARQGRREVILRRFARIQKEIRSRRTSKKIAIDARGEVTMLMNQLGIYEKKPEGNKASLSWALSGDGAPAVKP